MPPVVPSSPTGSANSNSDDDENKYNYTLGEITDKQLLMDGTLQYYCHWIPTADAPPGLSWEPSWENEEGFYNEEDGVIDWEFCTAIEKLDDFVNDPDNMDSLPGTAEPYDEIFELNRWAKAYKNGLHALIEELWDVHKERLADRYGYSWDQFRRSTLLILAAIPPKILKAMVCGSIQRSLYVDFEFRRLCDTYIFGYLALEPRGSNKEAIRPVIYVFEFTDYNGLPPLIWEASMLLDELERYLKKSQWEFAMQVDGADEDDATERHRYRQGFRKYLANARGEMIANRIDVLKEFIAKSRQWLNSQNSDYPIQPWRECGYAAHFFTREGNHFDEAGTNFIMAILNRLSFLRHDWKWNFRAQPVFQCFSESQPSLGELIITSISSSHPDDGHGCSWFPAGISVASAKQVDDWAWLLFEEEAWDIREIATQLGTEEKLIRKRRKNITSLKKDIARLEAEEEQDKKEVLLAEVRMMQAEKAIDRIHGVYCRDRR